MKKFFKILLCMMLVFSLCTPIGLASGETTTDVTDVTIRNFETDTGYQFQNSTGQWVESGMENSSGALEITATNGENGGVQFNSLHLKPGATYDISVMVKPTGSSTISTIDSPHLYLWLSTTAANTKDELVAHSDGFTKTQIGTDGWYKVSTSYTAPSEYAGTLTDIRFCPTGQGGATYIMDDFVCVPTGLLDGNTGGELLTVTDIAEEEAIVGNTVTAGVASKSDGTEVLYRVLCSSSADGPNWADVAHGFLDDSNKMSYKLTSADAGKYIKIEFVGINNGTITQKSATTVIQITAAEQDDTPIDVTDVTIQNFETGLDGAVAGNPNTTVEWVAETVVTDR